MRGFYRLVDTMMRNSLGGRKLRSTMVHDYD